MKSIFFALLMLTVSTVSAQAATPWLKFTANVSDSAAMYKIHYNVKAPDGTVSWIETAPQETIVADKDGCKATAATINVLIKSGQMKDLGSLVGHPGTVLEAGCIISSVPTPVMDASVNMLPNVIEPTTWTLVAVYGQVHHSVFEWFGVEPTITNLSTATVDGFSSMGLCNIATYDLKASSGTLSYGIPSKGGGDLRILLSTSCLEVN